MLAAGFNLGPLYTAFGWLLAFFYQPTHSLGLAIILLTLVVMGVQFPLIQKQTRSMIQMQRAQPEIKKIQQKYKDDRQKQNEELLKFYQEHKINPIAGCLPMLIILPIGIAVFRTFRNGIEKHLPTSGSFSRLYTDICTFQGKVLAPGSKQGLNGALDQCSYHLGHPPKGTPTPHVFYFLGMNLTWSAHEVQSKLSGHVVQWIPYFTLIALVILTGWYQVRQTQARQLRQGGAAPNAQMQAITKIMPVFFGVITYTLSAATTLYFVVSNLWRIGQQHFVLNKMYEEAVEKGEIKPPKETPKEPPKPPPAPETKTNKKAPPNRPKSPNSPGTPNKGPSGPGDDGGTNRPPSNAARRKKKRKR